MNQGEMKDFNLQCFIDAANELVRSDETIRALNLLDNLPAYYRDFKPKEVLKLKNEILHRIATPAVYSESNCDRNIDDVDRNGTSKTLRAQLLRIELEWLNKENLKPHVVDLGPGEYWLPFELKRSAHLCE